MSRSGRLFAVLPAAGKSRRMGQPKLLLPWRGETVVAAALHALDRDEIAERFVVIRPQDLPLQQAVAHLPAVAVVPETDPPTMRESVELALAEIESRFQPTDRDGWILIPADHPVIRSRLLTTLIAAWQQTRQPILVPTYQPAGESARRGHPTFFRWSLAERVRQLPADSGLNRLLRDHPHDVCELPVDDESVLWDLDTPDDYRRLNAIDPG